MKILFFDFRRDEKNKQKIFKRFSYEFWDFYEKEDDYCFSNDIDIEYIINNEDQKNNELNIYKLLFYFSQADYIIWFDLYPFIGIFNECIENQDIDCYINENKILDLSSLDGFHHTYGLSDLCESLELEPIWTEASMIADCFLRLTSRWYNIIPELIEKFSDGDEYNQNKIWYNEWYYDWQKRGFEEWHKKWFDSWYNEWRKIWYAEWKKTLNIWLKEDKRKNLDNIKESWENYVDTYYRKHHELEELATEEFKNPSRQWKDNPEAMCFLKMLDSWEQCIFLTWQAWTWKSQLITDLISKEHSINKFPVVLWSTWISALNIWWTTVHYYYKLNIMHKDCQQTYDDLINHKIKEWKRWSFMLSKEKIEEIYNAPFIIIDEISMLYSDTFDSINIITSYYLWKEHPECRWKPFWWKQVILIWDVFQLPPVVKWNDEEWWWDNTVWQSYESARFFDSKTFKNKINLPQLFKKNFVYKKIELKKNYRAWNDKYFADILWRIRNRTAESSDFEKLNECMNNKVPWHAIAIYPKNEDVRDLNKKKLDELNSPMIEFRAEMNNPPKWIVEKFTQLSTKNIWYKKVDWKNRQILQIKVWAKVMMMNNDPWQHRANWDFWTIMKIDSWKDPYVQVKIERTWKTYDIKKYTRYRTKTVLKKDWKWEVQNDYESYYTQFPIQLAYAITVHKSQWSTYDDWIINLSKTFENWQAYTAISRFRNLQSFKIEWRKISPDMFKFDERIFDFLKNSSTDDSLLSNDNLNENLKQGKFNRAVFFVPRIKNWIIDKFWFLYYSFTWKKKNKDYYSINYSDFIIWNWLYCKEFFNKIRIADIVLSYNIKDYIDEINKVIKDNCEDYTVNKIIDLKYIDSDLSFQDKWEINYSEVQSRITKMKNLFIQRNEGSLLSKKENVGNTWKNEIIDKYIPTATNNVPWIYHDSKSWEILIIWDWIYKWQHIVIQDKNLYLGSKKHFWFGKLSWNNIPKWYHIPSKGEFEKLICLLHSLWIKKWKDLSDKLLMPFDWWYWDDDEHKKWWWAYRSCTKKWQNNWYQLYIYETWFKLDEDKRSYKYSIRCFKDLNIN